METQPLSGPWPPSKGASILLHPPRQARILQLVYNRRSDSHILFGGRKWIYIGIFQIYFPISVDFGKRGLHIMCLSTGEFRKNWRQESRNF
jgi:hypothetical protein